MPVYQEVQVAVAADQVIPLVLEVQVYPAKEIMEVLAVVFLIVVEEFVITVAVAVEAMKSAFPVTVVAWVEPELECKIGVPEYHVGPLLVFLGPICCSALAAVQVFNHLVIIQTWVWVDLASAAEEEKKFKAALICWQQVLLLLAVREVEET